MKKTIATMLLMLFAIPAFATTTTFYPDPNVESTSVDGHVRNTGAGAGCAVWSVCHDATDGSFANDDTAASYSAAYAQLETGVYRVDRGFFLFDTSALGSTVTISSSTLHIWHSDTGSPDATEVLPIHVSSSTPASNTAITTADFDQYGKTDFGNLTGLSGATGYWHATMNASGRANISKTGVSKFATLANYDFTNSTPASNGDAWQAGWAEQAGTSQDPALDVVYSIPSTGGAPKVPDIIIFQ